MPRRLRCRRDAARALTRADGVVAAALTLAVVQVASLVVAPANPRPFTDGGAPYLAFVADRDIAGSQPDQFIVSAAPILAEFRRAVDAERSICPGRLPAR